MPADQGTGFGSGGKGVAAAAHHRFAAPQRLAVHRVAAIEKLEGTHRLLLAHREIEEAAAVEIGVLETIHIAEEQPIKAIDGWIPGADVAISTGQILLEARGGDARRGELHTRHRAGRLAARAHRVENSCPGVVGVAGEGDQSLAQGQGGLQDRLPLCAVTVPGVEVVGDLAGFGEEGLLGGGEAGESSAGGELLQRRCVLVEQGGIAGVEQQFRRNGHALHQHLLAEHLPGGGGGGHLLLQPGQLGGADHAAAGVPPGLLHGGEHQLLGHDRRQGIGKSGDGRLAGGRRHAGLGGIAGHLGWIGQDHADAGLHRCRIGILQLLIPRGEPGFEHVQGEHIAEAEGAIALGERGTHRGPIARLALAGFADRDPFVIGLQGRVAAGDPVAFRGALVVFGTTLPAVVGGFVVVPDGDQRGRGTQGQQARIGVVLGVALAVVVEAEDLALGQEAAAAGGVFGGAIAAGAVFVDVIANLKPGVVGIGAVDRRCPGVGIELLGRGEVGAGEDSQPHRVAVHRQGFGLPDARHRATGAESVVIGAIGAEASRLHLHGPVAGGAGGEAAAAPDRAGGKVGAGGQLPLHVEQPLETGGWGDAGPEDHRIGVGIAGGHTMGKSEPCRYGAAQIQIEQQGVVIGGAVGIGREEVAHRRIAVAVGVEVVVAEGAFGGVDAPVEGGGGLGYQRGRDQHVIEGAAHVHRVVEGVARRRLGREGRQHVAVAGCLQHPDRLLLGVGIEVAEDHPVAVAVAGGVGGDPLQQSGGRRGAGGVVGRLAIELIEIGAGGIGGALRLEVVDHHIHEFTAGQLPERLGQGRTVLRGATGQGIDEGLAVQHLGGPTRSHRKGVVDQTHLDRIAADQAGGHKAVGAARAGGLGGVEPLHDRRQGGVIGVVLELHQADHIGLQTHQRRGELAELALQLLGAVGTARRLAAVGEGASDIEGGEGVEHVEAGQPDLAGRGGCRCRRPGVLTAEAQRRGGVEPVFAEVVGEHTLHGSDRVAATQQLIAHRRRRRGR